jgi:hypothetical protein
MPLSEKHEHWESHLLEMGSLDSANEGIPLGAWARNSNERRGIQHVVRTYFDEYSDISFALWIWDIICSATVYAIIDGLGLVADILYDILEFILLLLLELFPTLLQVFTQLFMSLWEMGGYLFSIFKVGIEDVAIVVKQFLPNIAACVTGFRTCQSTEEAYTCCSNQQLWLQKQCGTPTVEPVSQFWHDIVKGQRPLHDADRLTSSNDRITLNAAVDLATGETKKHLSSHVLFLPRNREDWWNWGALPKPLKEQLTSNTGNIDQLEKKGGDYREDVWPYYDELDDIVYAQSMSGLHSCTGPGPATSWTCEDHDTSYFNANFPFEGAELDDSTSSVCNEGPNSVLSVDIDPRSETYNQEIKTCLRPHSKMHCIRELEYKGFLHYNAESIVNYLGIANGVRRSLSMSPSATVPETDLEYTKNVEKKCMAGCGDETVQEGGAGTLDFYGYRTVMMHVSFNIFFCRCGCVVFYNFNGMQTTKNKFMGCGIGLLGDVWHGGYYDKYIQRLSTGHRYGRAHGLSHDVLQRLRTMLCRAP